MPATASRPAPQPRSRTQHVRPTKPLTAGAVAVLMILSQTDQALTQVQIEAALAAPGERRISIADDVDFLDTVQFIERTMKPPKTARFLITPEGEAAIGRHAERAVRDLRAKIGKMQQPHPRDESTLGEDTVAPFQRLLQSLQTGRFGRIPMSQAEDEEAAPHEKPLTPPPRQGRPRPATPPQPAETTDDPELGTLDDPTQQKPRNATRKPPGKRQVLRPSATTPR